MHKNPIPNEQPPEPAKVRVTGEQLLAAYEELREAYKKERELRSRAESDAAVLAHAYEHDSRPPRAVVDRALQYRRRGR